MGGDVGDGALEQLQQGLLHALARNVTRDGNVVGGPGDLVDLIHENDAPLGLLDIVIGGLHQLEHDVLHILAHVAGLGQRGGVGDGEGHPQNARQGTGQQGLARSGGAEQEDVRLFQLDLVLFVGVPLLALAALLKSLVIGGRQTPVVVVDRHRQHLFGMVLTDHVFIEQPFDVRRAR